MPLKAGLINTSSDRSLRGKQKDLLNTTTLHVIRQQIDHVNHITRCFRDNGAKLVKTCIQSTASQNNMCATPIYKTPNGIRKLPNKLGMLFATLERMRFARHCASVVNDNTRALPFMLSPKRINNTTEIVDGCIRPHTADNTQDNFV